MWLIERAAVPSGGELRTGAELVLISLGLALALVSPFIAFGPDRPGQRPLPAARQVRRRFVLASELLACMCIAVGLYGVASDSVAGGFLLLLGGVSSLLFIVAFLSAHQLYARRAADVRARPPGTGPPDEDSN